MISFFKNKHEKAFNDELMGKFKAERSALPAPDIRSIAPTRLAPSLKVIDEFISSPQWLPDEQARIMQRRAAAMPMSFHWQETDGDDRTDYTEALPSLRLFFGATEDTAMKPTLPPVRISAEMIHAQFESASDTMIEKANDVLRDEEVRQAHRMHALGFVKHPVVMKHRDDIRAIDERNQSVPLVARYTKYGKKFILPAQAERIAKEYDLIIGGIHRFVGQLPIKNMVEIEAFKEAFDQKNDGGYTTANSWGEPKPGFKKRSQSQRVASGLQICAPLDQFEHTGAQRQGRYLVDDPIVLQPVIGGYLIVSAWGTEAEDPLVKIPTEG